MLPLHTSVKCELAGARVARVPSAIVQFPPVNYVTNHTIWQLVCILSGIADEEFNVTTVLQESGGRPGSCGCSKVG